MQLPKNASQFALTYFIQVLNKSQFSTSNNSATHFVDIELRSIECV